MTAAMTLRHLLVGRKVMTNLDSVLKNGDKGQYSQSYDFSRSHVRMWELDHKEGWALKNWYFWTVVLEKTPESPLDCKEIQPVHPKGDQILCVHWKDWCWSWHSNTLAIWCEELTHWKRPWCWEKLKAEGEGMTEDEMVGWHNWLSGEWFSANSGRQWRTGKFGMLQFMGLQRVGHNL